MSDVRSSRVAMALAPCVARLRSRRRRRGRAARWIPQAAGGRSMFWGTNGQNIFVDPVAKVVIVHLGKSQRAGFDGNRDLFALRDAIVRTLAAKDRSRRRFQALPRSSPSAVHCRT
jgi:CubicO group peptidase (beta-lactamase class C family)